MMILFVRRKIVIRMSVSKIFQRLLEQGDIYLGEYEGWYCTPDESFFLESQAGRWQMSGLRPSCREDEGRKLFLPDEQICGPTAVQYYEENPDFIQPESRKNEMINNFIKPGLEDLAVSRTTFDWGIKVPGDPKHVIYVWIDAFPTILRRLAMGRRMRRMLKNYWPADVHLMGKEIVRFHTIYWPIMLMALRFAIAEKGICAWLAAHEGWQNVQVQRQCSGSGYAY